MKNFALIGAAGYIAPRHMKAIQDTGNRLVAAYDPNDSVGIIDSFFPDADFFTEFERFDRHLEKLKRSGTGIDYVVVCSPNYLHDAHIRFGLRIGADVICEKPLVLNPWNVTALKELEQEFDRRIYTILQLRLHPALVRMKSDLQSEWQGTKHDVELTYITSRGKWYYASWKGDIQKSGGIATNIGIHFFDMLIWLFGDVVENVVHVHTHDRAGGYLELERARVRWFLSINPDTLPEAVRSNGTRTFRSIQVDGDEVEFSGGFTDLHTLSHAAVLDQRGFGIAEAAPSIHLVHDIRQQSPVGLSSPHHPLCKLPLSPHPFAAPNGTGKPLDTIQL